MKIVTTLMLAAILSACQFMSNSATTALHTPVLLNTTILTPPPLQPAKTVTWTPLPSTPSITPIFPPTNTPEPMPVPVHRVIVAVQPIPAGFAIPPQAIVQIAWPMETGLTTTFTDVSDVINQVALVDIDCFQPIVSAIIAQREVGAGFESLPGDCPSLPDLTEARISIALPQYYIPPGTIIRPGIVSLRAWPEVYAPPGAVHRFADIIGSVAQTGLFEEYPIFITAVD